jgi:hypothetical protein
VDLLTENIVRRFFFEMIRTTFELCEEQSLGLCLRPFYHILAHACDTFVDPFKVLTSVAPAQYPLSETGTGNIWRYSKGNTVERRIRLTHRIGGRETVKNYPHSRLVACMLTKSLNS